MYYFSQYDFLLIPALILSVVAQFAVNSAYKKYSNVLNRQGITGSEAARRILQAAGISDVSVNAIGGELTDNYHPVHKTLNLSGGVFGSSSVAAVGIAAHEAGHAIQHSKGYFPIKLRNTILPVAQISSTAAMPLFFIGLFMSLDILLDIGIFLFAGAVLFQLITLPVEFNASRRAVRAIEQSGILYGDELAGTKKVLRAAAMTYVASAAVAALQLIRLLGIAGSRRRD